MRRVLRAVTVMSGGEGGRENRPPQRRPPRRLSPARGRPSPPKYRFTARPVGVGRGAARHRPAAVARRGVGGSSPPGAGGRARVGGGGRGKHLLAPGGLFSPASEGAATNNRPFGSALVSSRGLTAESRPGEPRGRKGAISGWRSETVPLFLGEV